MPACFLHRRAQAHELLDLLGAARIKLQLDLYHCRVSEGGESLSHLAHALQQKRLAHVQLAGVEQRREPVRASSARSWPCSAMLGWQGHVGLEYRPPEQLQQAWPGQFERR